MSNELTERNRRVVEGVYEAATRGDFQTVFNTMDENLVVYEPPYLPYGGVIRGLDGFRKLMADISEYAELNKVRVAYSVADGDRVIGCLMIPDKKTGKDFHLLEQSTVRDGKIVEMRVFYFDAGSMIEAGLKKKA